jgi:predicted GIY-YIG superfamily endonuclease
VHFVYIVRCADGTLYTGYARDPRAREKVHNSGRGARYTSGRRPVVLVYSKACKSRGAALSREHQLKQWTRRKKEALIASGTAGPRAPRHSKSGDRHARLK